MKTKTPYRVLVCDGVALIRSSIESLFKNDSEFHVVDEAAVGQDSITKAANLKPDLVLMDVRMPDLDGAEATRQILLDAPETKVLAHSSDSTWETVDRMLGAGACGYVVKGPDLEEMLRAARTVLAGGHYLSLALLRPVETSD